jgi:hypothetical protein
MTPEEKLDQARGWFGVQEEYGSYFKAFCPAHDNRDTPALSVKARPDGVSVYCFSIRCPTEAICAAVGIEVSDLFINSEKRKDSTRLKSVKNEPQPEQDEPVGEARNQTVAEHRLEPKLEPRLELGYKGCTVQEYASFKGIPEEWLREQMGLYDYARHGRTKKPAAAIPYFDETGQEIRLRYRTGLRKPPEGKDWRFHWRTGSSADTLYGLDQLPNVRKNGAAVVIVEGESDVHTLRYHGFPALGVPGASNWEAAQPETFEGISHAYVVIEPDGAGEKLAAKLYEKLKHSLALSFVRLPDGHDPSSLYAEDPQDFKRAFARALKNAEPYTTRAERTYNRERSVLWDACKDLAASEDILSEFEEDIKKAGVMGQEQETKIIFLAAISRIFDTPSSIAVKGPSSAGKSFTLNKVLEFVPEEAYYKLTAMSDKALAHFDKPLKHRHLVIAEAAALDNSDMATYLTRTLLSEGYIQYAYPLATNDGVELHEVYVEGPTGLFITTTQQSLHSENETRLFSITVNDTRNQTRDVMLSIADDDGFARDRCDLNRWHALQRWITMAGKKKVKIPFGRWIAANIPDDALHVRLRRDFTQVLNCIRSQAVLHQVSRQIDEEGRILATCEDYRVVRDLLYDVVAEGLEASVPETVRETVRVVEDLIDELGLEDGDDEEGVTLNRIRERLRLDRSAAHRRVQTALKRGFVKNLEDKRGRPGKYALADPLPDDVVVLPEVAELQASGECPCSDCRRGRFRQEPKTEPSPEPKTDTSGEAFTHTVANVSPIRPPTTQVEATVKDEGTLFAVAEPAPPQQPAETKASSTKSPNGGKRRLSEEEAAEVQRLIKRGFGPKFAREAVLGSEADKEDKGG